MFLDIPPTIQKRMDMLEQIDARDRTDNTPRMQRLRQVPRDTGKFIALLAACAPAGQLLEIGTSAGYSTLWLALACRQLGRRITTVELLEEKAQLARETFRLAGVENIVDLVHADALDYLNSVNDIAFCFLDAEKEVYMVFYNAIIPKLVNGGILVADNAINHRATLEPMLNKVLADPRFDSMVVPIGKGELVCRKIGQE